MQTECSKGQDEFEGFGRRKVEGGFNGGQGAGTNMTSSTCSPSVYLWQRGVPTSFAL